MALLKEESEIVSIADLLSLNLTIPEYQRPYRWSSKSTNTLFNDTYQAFKSGIEEYRLGSIILHKKSVSFKSATNQYNLVDGQQRTTTLTILLYILDQNNQPLLNETYQPSSQNAIVDNYDLLTRRLHELSKQESRLFKDYLLNNCKVVKIVTDNEQEAFQFFDSQNSRGKALKPHDLLKAYHLREMKDETEATKLKLISEWEATNQQDLECLFGQYLYPTIRWSKNKDGLNYSADKIQIFKGIKPSNNFNYATYHRASNILIEQLNSNGSSELLGCNQLNQFQLTEPIIAGKRFFKWTLYYVQLQAKIENKIKKHYTTAQLPDKGAGNQYIKQLYEAVLMLFVDRFGFNELDDSVLHQLYTWSYSLRLKMKAVYPQTVNKYALGQHERLNLGLDLFNRIEEMNDPQELKTIALAPVDNAKNYQDIYELMKGWNW
ncbi:DUF262 domain-containing protein [Lactiplantibacillus garii]|uniref:DUF262 domain-containing protein n=1 Tax=Lactiplantibacillus garii TaxID=2306423 RepID=A0A3R8KDM6_9LACO|nr:DUF262 domain-containing protein [Lactiplantibacillus garii]RRK09853.1 DUF262 domain-containing protein [Lactiplantibacillus garii]